MAGARNGKRLPGQTSGKYKERTAQLLCRVRGTDLQAEIGKRGYRISQVLGAVILLMYVMICGCGKDDEITEEDEMIGKPTYEETAEEHAPAAKTATLSFDSFDGGGPDFNVVIADESIASCESRSKYNKADHERMNGAGYQVIITFKGIKPGETTALIEERSPIADNLDHRYRLVVDDELNMTLELLSVKDINDTAAETMTLMIDGEEYPVEWEENESVEALKKLCPLTVEMSMYGGFEQVGALGCSLPENDQQTTTSYGDIVLYSGDQIVVFYGTNSWSYTRLGHILADREILEEALGNGDVTIELLSE